MKTLPGNNAGPQWHNNLLDDLVFIKQHLRYPISKKTIPSVALIAIFGFFLVRMVSITMMVNYSKHLGTAIFISALVVISLMTGVVRYVRTLRFRSIATPYFALDNMKLVEAFLRVQQLNLYRHPKAPEVFQILSRPIGNTEQREVMIFIADDKRILVNSHFINQKWMIAAASKNASSMARQLEQWIMQNSHVATQGVNGGQPVDGGAKVWIS